MIITSWDATMYQKVWSLAWPLILSNISVPLLGIVDTAILGHLADAQHLASVALGSSILAFLYWGFGFLRMSNSGLTAQAVGKRDFDRVSELFFQSLLISSVIGITILFLGRFFVDLLLPLMNSDIGINNTTEIYCYVRLTSLPAALVTFSIIGWFIGKKQTKYPVYIIIFSNILNMFLDYIFIIHLKLDSKGAAIATVLAEYSGLLLGLFLVFKYGQLRIINPFNVKQLSRYKALLSSNHHLFLRSLLLVGSFAFFTSRGAHQGEAILATNAILMQLVLFASFTLDGFAHALEALTGSALGAKKLRDFYQSIRIALFYSMLCILVYTLFLWRFQNELIFVFTDIEPVQILLAEFWPWLMALPTLSLWAYILDGIFIGSGQSKTMRNAMLICVVLIYLPAWYFTQAWGNHGLWFAFAVFSLARGGTLALSFWQRSHHQRWLKS
jgi:MATE family multidrug resistance protein